MQRASKLGTREIKNHFRNGRHEEPSARLFTASGNTFSSRGLFRPDFDHADQQRVLRIFAAG
jgi:hypothetical protein